MRYRDAAVAGHFYPASAKQLRDELSVFLTSASDPKIQAHALIVPHAGYCYSADVAGKAYAYITSFASQIKRVVLLGPSHRVALQGCAICSYDAFVTPLGQIDVATKSYRKLLKLGLVKINDQAHLLEHALEVQLPFLQYCLDDFKIVPIVVGQCQPDTISAILDALQVNDAESLVIVSSDLSHYHAYQQAQVLDEITINKIINYNATLVGDDACGCYCVNGLLAYANSQKWQIKLLKKANSGDVLEAKEEVVGYASFILY